MASIDQNDTIIKKIELPFANLEIYSDHIISSIHEGVVFDKHHLEQLNEIFALYFSNKPFGYIANRANDYTVNPVCYLETNLMSNMSGMAVWCHTERNYKTATFTKQFFPKPYEPFFTYEECKSWLKKQLTQ